MPIAAHRRWRWSTTPDAELPSLPCAVAPILVLYPTAMGPFALAHWPLAPRVHGCYFQSAHYCVTPRSRSKEKKKKRKPLKCCRRQCRLSSLRSFLPDIYDGDAGDSGLVPNGLLFGCGFCLYTGWVGTGQLFVAGGRPQAGVALTGRLSRSGSAAVALKECCACAAHGMTGRFGWVMLSPHTAPSPRRRRCPSLAPYAAVHTRGPSGPVLGVFTAFTLWPFFLSSMPKCFCDTVELLFF